MWPKQNNGFSSTIDNTLTLFSIIFLPPICLKSSSLSDRTAGQYHHQTWWIPSRRCRSLSLPGGYWAKRPAFAKALTSIRGLRITLCSVVGLIAASIRSLHAMFSDLFASKRSVFMMSLCQQEKVQQSFKWNAYQSRSTTLWQIWEFSAHIKGTTLLGTRSIFEKI